MDDVNDAVVIGPKGEKLLRFAQRLAEAMRRRREASEASFLRAATYVASHEPLADAVDGLLTSLVSLADYAMQELREPSLRIATYADLEVMPAVNAVKAQVMPFVATHLTRLALGAVS